MIFFSILRHLSRTFFSSFAGGQISVVQALLEELPGQFLTYVRSRDIVPLNVGQSHSEAHTQQRV